MQSTLGSILEQISSLLTGDLNHDRTAEAKQLINQLLDSQEWRTIKRADEFLAKTYGEDWKENLDKLYGQLDNPNQCDAAQTKRKDANKQEDLNNQINHSKIKDNSFLVVKVGNQDAPACKADIEQVRDAFAKALRNESPDLPIIVTHHAVDVELHTTLKTNTILGDQNDN